MKQFFTTFVQGYFHPRLSFRVRLFNVLAIGGVVISAFMTLFSVFADTGILSVLLNFAIGVLSFALLAYSSRSGNYQRCYLITIVFIFFGMFTALFFSSGGYHSGMPAFFIFAVLFTVFMLEGKAMYILVSLEIVYYPLLCVYGYLYPAHVHFLNTELDVLIDILVCFLVVSVTLGVTMSMHFRLYNRQQRELEAARAEAEEYSNAKSVFLASMSHEIRTPINVILGMNEMILRESDSKPIIQYSRSIQNAGKTLRSLISNILDMSKIEAGKLHVVTETYLTANLIEDLAQFGAELAERRGLSFRTEVDDGLPCSLIGGFEHIKQVVLNLLGNAAKYTREGGVVLSVSGIPGDSEEEILLRLSVADTGIGIRQEDLAILFDTFTRVDPAVTSHLEGAGLGLSISRELTEHMGGHISVESVYNKGSVFTVEIPQKVNDRTPILERSYGGAEAGAKREGSFIAPGASVLVVDDNSENLQMIRMLLARTMLRVDTAESGAQCLEAVRQNHYHVIIMDYMMPAMNGIETMEHLRRLPGFHTPVIALTANVLAEARQKLLEAGFLQCLSKPIVWKELESALQNHLPPELVTAHTVDTDDDLPLRLKRGYAAELQTYGIALDDGLRYFSGDAKQYMKIAEIFLESSDRSREAFSVLVGQKEWAQLKYQAHSLKSKAGAIGANTLANTAAKLENLCGLENSRHIALLVPIVFYEWEQVVSGLSGFCNNARELLAERDSAGTQTAELADLLPLLRYNRQPDALEMIDQLLASAQTPKTDTALQEIRKRVNDVEFREAEQLLIPLLGG